MKTTVRVYLRSMAGKCSFTTPINLPEEEAIKYYLGKWWNMEIDCDLVMFCYKVEIINN